MHRRYESFERKLNSQTQSPKPQKYLASNPISFIDKQKKSNQIFTGFFANKKHNEEVKLKPPADFL